LASPILLVTVRSRAAAPPLLTYISSTSRLCKAGFYVTLTPASRSDVVPTARLARGGGCHVRRIPEERIMTMYQPGPDSDLQRAVATAIHEHWALFLIEGIVLVLLGAAAIL